MELSYAHAMSVQQDLIQPTTHLLYRHHGGGERPDVDQTGICCFCRTEGPCVDLDTAVNHTYFSDYDLMDTETGLVCIPCAYCLDTRTLKQGHWIAHVDGLLLPSTGDLLDAFRSIRAGDYEAPLAIHVTSSPIRSSHAYLWTPTNATTSPLSIAFDRERVRISDWDAFEQLLVAVEDLRLNGFTFDEIRSDEPRVGNLRTIGRDAYQDRTQLIDPARRTPRLDLALTLSRGADDQPRTDISDDHEPLHA